MSTRRLQTIADSDMMWILIIASQVKYPAGHECRTSESRDFDQRKRGIEIEASVEATAMLFIVEFLSLCFMICRLKSLSRGTQGRDVAMHVP